MTHSQPEEKTQNEKPQKKWYAIHTYAGYEDAVCRYLKQRIESLGMENKIFNVIVPKETKIKVKNGKRQVIEEKIYPGYVLVEMILDNESWYIVRNTPRVSGFIGAEGKTPSPLSDEEIKSLFSKMEKKETGFKIDLKVNELVKITDGPFKDKEGKIIEVDEERGKIKVLVPVFGRDTAVELDSLQVQKI